MPAPTFQALRLSPPVLAALDARGYREPTPIQQQAIPHLLEGRDLLGIAQTGTGKTAAFALPLLEELARSGDPAEARAPHALVLTPTRELAAQVGDAFLAYGRGLRLRTAVVFGGVGQGRQVEALRRGVDVLVATPGRLLDLVGQRHVDLRRVRHFVLDEADRMLDMGFLPDVRRVIESLPPERQSLLFSATMPDEVARIAQRVLRDPVRVEVSPPASTVERVVQRVYLVEKADKRALLAEILADTDVVRALVFTRTRHGADRVVRYLRKNADLPVEAIHSDKSQGARERALKAFRGGKVMALVATDIAARGIDVPDVTHVINFDLPNVPEAYVHRIGRTARAGRDGVALSLCDVDERAYLRAIESAIRQRLEIVAEHPFRSMVPLQASPPPKPKHKPKSKAGPKAGPSAARSGKKGPRRRGHGERRGSVAGARRSRR